MAEPGGPGLRLEVGGGWLAGAVRDAVVEALCVTGTGAGSSVAPHIPQKRFGPGFSLPQRGQRTIPPLIDYDKSKVGCSVGVLRVLLKSLTEMQPLGMLAG